MSIEIAIASIVVLLIMFVGVRWYNAKAAREEAENPRPTAKAPSKLPKERSPVAHESTPYHAVSIHFAPNACEAAKAIAGKRYLSAAAPKLPLPDCDVLECKCRFIHHSDRRKGSDRRGEVPRGFGGDATGEHREERRKRPERRHDDDDDAKNLFS